jgi:NADH dehydrogenase
MKIVIIGAGFGGIHLAKKLCNCKHEVVLVDKNNYHCFQPLLYQVATAGLETGTISYPIRRMLQRHKNFRFYWAEVVNIDVEQKKLQMKTPSEDESINFDVLVLATGTRTNFFGFESKKGLFMSLKTIPEALNLRSYMLQNLELAVMEESKEKRAELLNIAIVGGGPTGVELAGALAEMKKHILPKDYPELNLDEMHVSLFQRGERILDMLHPSLSEKALNYLRKMGVSVYLKTAVTDYDGDFLTLNGTEKFPTDTVIWAAGVRAVSPNGLEKATILPNGRLQVDGQLRVVPYNNIYAIGDLAYMPCNAYPNGHPQVAPVAIDMAKYLAKIFKKSEQAPKDFVYKHKGSMAVVGRNKAVVDLPKFRTGGFLAWIIWMFVHMMSLVGFRNKTAAFFSWAYSYFTYEKALRLIIRPYRREDNF